MTKSKSAWLFRAVTAVIVGMAAISATISPAQAAGGWTIIENGGQKPIPYDKGGKDADVTVSYKGKYEVTAWFNAQGDNFYASNRTTKKAYYSMSYFKGHWRTATRGYLYQNGHDLSYMTWGFVEQGPYWWWAEDGFNLKEGRAIKITVCADTSSGGQCATAYGTA